MTARQLIHHQHVEPDDPPGLRLAQLALARTVAHKERCDVLPIVQRLFPNDSAALAVARAASGSADTSTAGWAAALLRADTVAMLRDIAPISAAARLAAAGTQVRFETVVPAVPWIDPSAEPAWVGEGGVIPVLQGTVAGERIPRCKLAGVVSITKELERSSDGVEVMRQMLRMGAANMLDRSLLDAAAAVPFVRPAGLLNGVVLGTGSAAGGLAAMAADVAALHAAFHAAGCGADVVLIVNSGTLAALSVLTLGSLGGQQIIGTPAVPADTCIAVDAAYFASAFEPIELDISGGVMLTMANADDTAPTQAMDAVGALGTAGEVLPDRGISVAGGVAGAANVGYQAVSMFQAWKLAIRLAWPVGFAITMPGAVQGLEDITWANAPTP